MRDFIKKTLVMVVVLGLGGYCFSGLATKLIQVMQVGNSLEIARKGVGLFRSTEGEDAKGFLGTRKEEQKGLLYRIFNKDSEEENTGLFRKRGILRKKEVKEEVPVEGYFTDEEVEQRKPLQKVRPIALFS